jgi:hypothetical protein
MPLRRVLDLLELQPHRGKAAGVQMTTVMITLAVLAVLRLLKYVGSIIMEWW